MDEYNETAEAAFHEAFEVLKKAGFVAIGIVAAREDTLVHSAAVHCSHRNNLISGLAGLQYRLIKEQYDGPQEPVWRQLDASV